MSKRKKIIITSFLLAVSLVLIQLGYITERYTAILILTSISILLGIWSLKERFRGMNLLVALLLPTLFTTGIGFFYFLLPSQLVAQIPIIVLYGLGIYVLLLTQNIFLVASLRNIQLLRAAQATGFLLTLVTGFFLFDTILSFRLSAILNFVAIFIVSFLLCLQSLWTITLEDKISAKLVSSSLLLSLALAEVALAISFWPLTVSTGSLFLITILYILLGLSQSDLQERLFKKTIKEYLWVGIVVFLTILFTTHWGG